MRPSIFYLDQRAAKNTIYSKMLRKQISAKSICFTKVKVIYLIYNNTFFKQTEVSTRLEKVGLSNICDKKLSLSHSRSFLDFVCPAVLPSQWMLKVFCPPLEEGLQLGDVFDLFK